MTRECKERPCGGYYHEPAPSDRHRDNDPVWPWSIDDYAMPAAPHITRRPPPGGFIPSNPAQRIFDHETLKAEVAWDLAQLVIDIGGIFDPSPVSDGLNLLISLARGNWDDALISGASMVPYVGDATKLGKLPGYLNTLRLARNIAETDSQWRKALKTVFSKLKPLLDKIDEVGAKRMHPQMRRLLRDLRREVDEFLGRNLSGGIARQDYVSVTQGRQPQRTMGPLDEEPVEVASMPSALKGAGDGGRISGRDVVPDSHRYDNALFSAEIRQTQAASKELLDGVAARRDVHIAVPDSDDMRFLELTGADASAGGPGNLSIIVKENPQRLTLMEEFLHGTQSTMWGDPPLEVSDTVRNFREWHVRDFMNRHQKMFGWDADELDVLQAELDYYRRLVEQGK